MPTPESHSPTPWAPFGKQVIDANQRIIAQCKSEADAALMAAAPGYVALVGPLVAACRAMVSSLAGFSDAYNFGEDDEAALAAGRAALAAIGGPGEPT